MYHWINDIRTKTMTNCMPDNTVVLQTAHIQAIDNELPVKIDIDTKSKKIQIEGQAEVITSALDRILSIFLELEKEERNKLEAETVSKEVIARFFCFQQYVINTWILFTESYFLLLYYVM